MPALEPRGSGVYRHHVVLAVTHDFQDMRMSADKYLWSDAVYQGSGAKVIMTRISPYMHHEDGHSATFEGLMMWIIHTDVLAITVPIDADQRLERGDFLCCLKSSSEISGMPDLIHRFKEFLELF